MTEWLLDQALEKLASSLHSQPLILAFSISSQQLQSSRFIAYIQKLIQKHQVNIGQLEFTLLPQKDHAPPATVEECIDSVNHIGARFGLKKYGENTLNLLDMYRNDIPVLHLSPSLVQVTLHNKQDVELLETLIMVAHRWKRQVVAGGILTQENIALLRNLQCDQVKGSFIGEHLPYDSLLECLSSYNTEVSTSSPSP